MKELDNQELVQKYCSNTTGAKYLLHRMSLSNATIVHSAQGPESVKQEILDLMKWANNKYLKPIVDFPTKEQLVWLLEYPLEALWENVLHRIYFSDDAAIDMAGCNSQEAAIEIKKRIDAVNGRQPTAAPKPVDNVVNLKDFVSRRWCNQK